MIAYNATAPNNYPLAYVGQDLYQSGVLMGQRIAQEVTSGLILVGISQPGGNNVQPRLDGIKAALSKAAPNVSVLSVNTGAAQAGELSAMESSYQGHQSAKGIYAVDAGSTAAIAQLISKYSITGKVHAGGFDLLTDTITGVKSGALDFTIDQSAYMQGFLRFSTSTCTGCPARWSSRRHRHRPDLRHQGQRRPVRDGRQLDRGRHNQALAPCRARSRCRRPRPSR